MNRSHKTRLRILAVDDEPNVLDTYQGAITHMGRNRETEDDFELTLCTQGDQALSLVEEANRRNDPFAVIFLDLKLPPGPDGIWTGERIRKLDPFVNFVIVTGM
ncbi:MAG: hybrid sensor histidine kinase/response regulator, partial [Candidatus Hermodarchaeia archaeon]